MTNGADTLLAGDRSHVALDYQIGRAAGLSDEEARQAANIKEVKRIVLDALQGMLMEGVFNTAGKIIRVADAHLGFEDRGNLPDDGKPLRESEENVKIKRVDREAGETGRGGEEGGSNTVKDGASRAAQYSSGWGNASLQETIDKFAPNAEPMVMPNGKIIYNNQETGISVVYDKKGNYFRIEDTTKKRGRNYLDLDGNDMNNEIANGKTQGRSKADYQRVTHFNNSDK